MKITISYSPKEFPKIIWHDSNDYIYFPGPYFLFILFKICQIN